jgi:hypothetical protein
MSQRLRSALLSVSTTSWLLLLCGLGALAILWALTAYGSLSEFEPLGISTANRTMNQTMALVVTCIALVIPLTANLYTPRLVRLYVSHPLVAGGLSCFFLGQVLILSLHAFPPTHPYAQFAQRAVVVMYVVIMAGALPYLYGLSQFLRPAYFIPMLTRKAMRAMDRLAKHPEDRAAAEGVFETVDVITNIALTGLARGDRQLVLHVLGGLHGILMELIIRSKSETDRWRNGRAWFVPGLAREGQTYLVREGVWPEAYVLAQGLKVMETSEKRQQEMVSEFADHLVVSAGFASVQGRSRVVELHVMAFNTLLRSAVDAKDLRRFQNLVYYGRLLVEALQEDPYRMLECAGNIVHYARLADRTGMHNALETVTYDLGELALSLGSPEVERAVELVQAWAGPLWQEGMAPDSPLRKATWRTILRVFWEAKAAGLQDLADAVYWRFLTDEVIHREQLELVLEENRELHFEFNDRLLRFAALSPKAVAEAQAFIQPW